MSVENKRNFIFNMGCSMNSDKGVKMVEGDITAKILATGSQYDFYGNTILLSDIGFTPRLIEVVDVTARAGYEIFGYMTANTELAVATATSTQVVYGGRSNSQEFFNIKADGYEIALSSARWCRSGNILHWKAYE